MSITLATEAEKQAKAAEELPAFSGLKLLHIKRQLSELLKLIGGDGIFDEYTKHDISHIDAMLEILQWLIPQPTKEIMTPADWALTVLAIYFHDLGMLVTRNEYENRASSGFLDYRDNVLYAGDLGRDYRARVAHLIPERANRFLYQEFVRQNHGERIRNWIMGRPTDHLGVTHEVMSQVVDLLQVLDPQFRRDLALVCESHHLDDLTDFRKYKPSQPYGNTEEETANVQYAAILLRISDLFHITTERTPSIVFKAISPTDPISQEEWANQMAVKRVRSQVATDTEGNLDEKAPRDTIEVHAYFTEESGFFGLAAYLVFAQAEVRKTYAWAREANRQKGVPHQFPWRRIDDTNIETKGFLRDTFEFTVDQPKILDLLTGHTLYNDTRVVLREIVQNAIDAVRLQELIEGANGQPQFVGRVTVHWNSKQRLLTVQDNGTGMTQDIIERHLLKVGASRYQDSDFQRQYPDFSPISRFGIGLLATFMIADSVEIITCHPDDDEARRLSLRSVHGRYLIRLLDKRTDEIAKEIAPHGTAVKLSVRPSARIPDVIEAVRRWVVVPECSVSVSVDADDPVEVGFASPKEALAHLAATMGLLKEGDDIGGRKERVQIREKEISGLTVAYAVEWSPYFREWSFMTVPSPGEEEDLLLGTCVEGLRVEFASPGFSDKPLLAMANATGRDAPRTNVVRTGLELTPEHDQLLQTIYRIYLDHIAEETKLLQKDRHFSLTWATNEAQYLLFPLLEGRRTRQPHLLIEALRKLPVILVERQGQRSAVSAEDLSKEPWFWTVDCPMLRPAELLMREVPTSHSLTSLLKGLGAGYIELPDGPLLCALTPRRLLDACVFPNREIDILRADLQQRRVDLRWGAKTDPPRWRSVVAKAQIIQRMLRYQRQETVQGMLNISVGEGNCQISGLSDEMAVRAFGNTYILPGSALSKLLLSLIARAHEEQNHQAWCACFLSLNLTYQLLGTGEPPDREALRALADRIWTSELSVRRPLGETLEIERMLDVMLKTSWRMFDPGAWTRMQD